MAIGGISAATAAEVWATGVDGICVVSEICGAADPAEAARRLRCPAARTRVMTATALTVAGSDPSGGAGIQADLKTFSALGVYGTAVLTALTAQNTRGVIGVHPVPAAFVGEQLRTLLDDVTVHATKLGMLGTAEVVHEVAAVLRERRCGRWSATP